MSYYPLWIILFTFLLIPGALLVLVPLFPAFWYLMAMATLFAVLDGFVHFTAANLAVLGVIFLLSIVVDWSAGLLGAKFGGAAWKSILWGACGSVIGLLLFPPFGVFAGLFLGVLGSELSRHRGRRAAVRAATGAVLGSVTGIALNAILAVTFVVLFVVFAL